MNMSYAPTLGRLFGLLDETVVMTFDIRSIHDKARGITYYVRFDHSWGTLTIFTERHGFIKPKLVHMKPNATYEFMDRYMIWLPVHTLPVLLTQKLYHTSQFEHLFSHQKDQDHIETTVQENKQNCSS